MTGPARSHRIDRAADAGEWHERLTELIAEHRVPGATLGILHDGAITATGTGVLSKSTGVEVTPDSLFQVGSITKVWTATLVMQLVDEGLLELDAPVVDTLPEFRVADPDVTLTVTTRHLLNHTSGIDGDVFTDTGRGDDCLERYVAGMAEVAQTHPLGTTWSYCNSGYVLLGRIVEHLTGTTWDAALRGRLIEPLGLKATATLPEEAIVHRVAVGHLGKPGEESIPTTTWGFPRSTAPAGAVTASVHDVLAFARMHLDGGRATDGGEVLSAASVAAMATKEADLPDRHTLGDSWGLGWIRFGWDGERLVGHDGTTLGQAATLRVLPAQGLAVAALANGGNTNDLFHVLHREIFERVAGVAKPPPLEPPDPPPQLETASFAGRYERAGVTTDVVQRDGGLVLVSTVTGPFAELLPTPVQEFELVPVEAGLFAMRRPETTTWIPVTFYALADGSRYVHYGARANPLV